jgi:GNAT superfamily N-acetyltransferase
LEEGVIVGNSSLKQPRDEYVEAVNKQTGLDLAHYLERGYTSVRPEYRGMGIGTRLLEGLTARTDKKKLFSIIGADNIAAQKMALRNNTKQIATFYSQHMGKDVGVWVPDGQELG